ncbi:MAG: type II toxin-antitoxin system RelE/ParE family toxin [Methanosarcinales archaeon]|nr:MAG: type II toxin-antitoxin system RelE/ParE family toxin [Methanosarcinales archaeon]
MSYKVNYTAKARKDLKNLPPAVAKRIILSINSIRDDPYTHAKKIKGAKRHPLYTHRVGDYRAIMDITEDRLLIMVMETRHRSKIYRKY